MITPATALPAVVRVDVEEKQWHDRYAPANVHAAWKELQDCIARYRGIAADWQAINDAEAEHNAARDAAYRAYVDGGAKPSAKKARDWPLERDESIALLRAVFGKAKGLRRTYNSMQRDPAVLSEWRSAILAEYGGKRERAADLAAKAQAAYDEWLSATSQLYRVSDAMGLIDRETHAHVVRNRVVSVGNAPVIDWPAIRRVLETDDVVTSGEWLTGSEADMRLPMPVWARRVYADYDRLSKEYKRLAELETSEGYAVTSLTRR